MREKPVSMRIHPLRQFRREQEWTQERLANFLGVHPITVARWELGTRQMDPAMVARISRLTGIEAALLRPDLARAFA